MIKLIEEFIANEFGALPEHLFQDNTAVFRNARNKKWFAIIMKIPARKLQIDKDGLVDIINLKNTPQCVSMLLGAEGVYPAYHMNKENWITILLNDKIPLGMTLDLITQSYEIIDKKR